MARRLFFGWCASRPEKDALDLGVGTMMIVVALRTGWCTVVVQLPRDARCDVREPRAPKIALAVHRVSPFEDHAVHKIQLLPIHLNDSWSAHCPLDRRRATLI